MYITTEACNIHNNLTKKPCPISDSGLRSLTFVGESILTGCPGWAGPIILRVILAFSEDRGLRLLKYEDL